MKLPWVSLVALILATLGASGQTITTLAGNGGLGFAGDFGLAANAMLNHPRGVAVDGAGNLYIADVDNARVRKIAPNGIITTVVGNGVAGFGGDFGPAVNAMINGPQAVAVDVSGNLFIADTQNRVIRKVDTSGTITTVAGIPSVEGYSGDGGLATQAMMHQPMDLAIDGSGNIYFADSTGQRIRKIATNGIITTVAGNGTAGFSGDGGIAAAAQLNFPVSVALDGSNNLYISDGNNFRIRKVSNGIMTTVVGNGAEGFSGDGGAATSAMLNFAYGVRVDYIGRIFIADASNNRVRVVSGGTINTLAGTGVDGFSGDGGLATQAMLNFPWSLAIDGTGNLMIGDRVNSRVRTVFSVASVAPPPAITPNSMVNAASYAPALSANGSVAAGSIVAVFGANLSSGTSGAAGLPLATTLLDTTLNINGIPAPLFFVSNGQVNAQVPLEVPSGTVTFQVKRGTQATVSQTVQIVPASPGVFTLNAQGTGDGAFLHANYQIVSSANPAAGGETILIYCTGLGATNPRATTGAGAPGNATTTLTPTVTIGGRAALVTFSGLAPGFVGLYQINAQVPTGLAAGSQAVTVQMNGIQANTTTVATR